MLLSVPFTIIVLTPAWVTLPALLRVPDSVTPPLIVMNPVDGLMSVPFPPIGPPVQVKKLAGKLNAAPAAPTLRVPPLIRTVPVPEPV